MSFVDDTNTIVNDDEQVLEIIDSHGYVLEGEEQAEEAATEAEEVAASSACSSPSST